MVMIPKKGKARLSLSNEQDSVVLNFLSRLTGKFSPYLLASIPLTALIVVFCNVPVVLPPTVMFTWCTSEI